MTVHDDWERVHSQRGWGKWPRDTLNYFLTAYRQSITGNPKDVKLLDVGCGNGNSMWLALAIGLDAYGVDISESAVKRTKEFLKNVGHPEAKVQVSDMAKLPYEDNFFNVVIDICSLQHNPAEARQEIVKEINRVLVQDGHYFLVYRSRESYLEPEPFPMYPLDKKELSELFSPYFDIQAIEREAWTQNNDRLAFVHYDIFAIKKG